MNGIKDIWIKQSEILEDILEVCISDEPSWFSIEFYEIVEEMTADFLADRADYLWEQFEGRYH